MIRTKRFTYNSFSVAIASALVVSSAVAGSKLNSEMDFSTHKQDDALYAQLNKLNESRTEIIVRFKDEVNQERSKFNRTPLSKLNSKVGTVLSHVRELTSGTHLLRVNDKSGKVDLDSLLKRLNSDESVDFAEVNGLMFPLATPNDQYYTYQWHYHDSTGGIRAPEAWDVTQGEGVVVAVLDTGYINHPDLTGNLLSGYDMISSSAMGNDGNGRDSNAFDSGDWLDAGECGTDGNGNPVPAGNTNNSWHGTHVTGTIAATTNNTTGVAGVAYKSKVVPVRVLGKCGGTNADIADGIVWAAGGSVSGVPSNPNPAKVINMSLGGTSSCPSVIQNAINTARGLGAVVIVASGNDGHNASNTSPANCSGVVTVGGTDKNGDRSLFGGTSGSNYGANVDISAPGGNMVSAASGGIASTKNAGTRSLGAYNYSYSQGTSMATPHVAGVAALMVSVKPSATPSEIESVLKSTAKNFPSGSTCNTSNCGAGMLDAKAAVDAMNVVTPPPSSGTNYSGSLSGAGDSDVQPNGTYFQYNGGTIIGTLTGPSNADFDLELYKWTGSWTKVAAAETGSSNETISYSASNSYYYFKVLSYSGSGSYQLNIQK